MSRKEFVEQVGELLRRAKPNLIFCEYIETDEDEICRVHCENGYHYDVNITGDSLCSIMAAVANKMCFK